MKRRLQAAAHHLQRTAALIYWRVRLLRIRRRINQIDADIARQQRDRDISTRLTLIELQRKQQGRVLERQACCHIKALGGTLRRDAAENTPQRRHYEQPT